MENYLNTYDYNEATAFEGLMPKVMEKLGTTTGDSELSVGIFEHNVLGAMPMETIDVVALMEEEGTEGDGN